VLVKKPPKKPPKKPRSIYERKLAARQGWVDKAGDLSEAIRRIVEALAPLEVEDKLMVIRWAAEAHYIDPGKLSR
jgi:hypothetical protein